MTRNFCDICGEPAVMGSPNVERKDPIGQPVTWAVGEEMAKQVSVTTHVRFGFANHPSGFGGPPDLCKKCRVRLLHDIWAMMEDERQQKDQP